MQVRFLVVLNGCRDGTASIIRRLSDEFDELDWMEFLPPVGKGGALLAGFRHAAAAEWAGFADADGATPPDSLFALLDEPTADVMVGCRIMSKRPLGRRVTSFGFNLVVRLLFGLRTRDTQCGAKFFRAAVLPRILAEADTCDMAVDVDLLIAARSAGATICERTVAWEDQPGSKVRVVRTSALMFLSACRIFFRRAGTGFWYRTIARLLEAVYSMISGGPRPMPPSRPDHISLR